MKVGKQENALIVVFYFVLCSLKDVGFFYWATNSQSP